MTTHEPDSPDSVDGDGIETLVRTRFEDAVGVLDLDVSSLVTVGTAGGQRLRRRRRLQGVGLAAGIAVIAAGGVVGLQGGLFDNSSPEVKQPPVQKLVPSNSRAQVAALIEILPAGLAPTTWTSFPPKPTAIGAGTSIHWDGKVTTISVGAQRYVNQRYPLNCQGRSAVPPNLETCRMVHLAGAGIARIDINIQGLGSASAQENLDLIVYRPGVEISLVVGIGGVTTAQRAQISQLAQQAANDPALGLTTYPRFIKAEQSVPGWVH